MKLSHLTLAVASTLTIMNVAHASGLEKSQQPISALFEDGNYAEVTYSYIKPNIKAKDAMGSDTSDMIDEYDTIDAAFKIKPTENSTLAIFYSQPWGVDTTYKSGKVFINDFGKTEAHVDTDAVSIIGGGKLGDSGFKLYGGLDYQTITGAVTAATPVSKQSAIEGVLEKAGATVEQYEQLVKGKAMGVLDAQQEGTLNALQGALKTYVPLVAGTPTFYDLKFEDTSTIVPVVGLAYEKPEIALRAAVTYRAPAKYKIAGKESLTVPASQTAIKDYKGLTAVNFPQSVTLNFETGLSEKHQLLGMIDARWVEWSAFNVAPPVITKAQKGTPLVSYNDDQYSVSVGLGKQITPKFAGSVKVGYDYGGPADASLSPLGPYGAVTSLAMGGKYNVTDALSISGGAQYMLIDGGTSYDENDPEKTPVLTVEDSDGYAVGVNLGYSF